MEGLQRSSETFRRSGSSGLVWEDKNFSGEIKPAADDAGGDRTRSAAHAHAGYRTTGHVAPALDPPSPRVAVCGFCRLFGGGEKGKGKDGSNKAKSTGRRH